MATNRIARIIIGLALIGYALYSGNAWFYLGVLPLFTGIINWCPLEMKMGTCDPASGCCASTTTKKESTCCSTEASSDEACCSTTETTNSCCTPAKKASETKVSSFKPVTKPQDGTTKIEILGTGCTKCVALEKVVNEVINSLEGNYEVEKVSDIQEIMAYNVVSTPGLVINGTVVSTGKLLTADEVKKLLTA